MTTKEEGKTQWALIIYNVLENKIDNYITIRYTYNIIKWQYL